MLAAGEIGLDEGRSLVEAMAAGVIATQGREYDLVLVRRLGLSTWLLVPAGCDVLFEPAARAVVRLGLPGVAERLAQALK